MLKTYKQSLAEQDLINIWLYTFENFGVNQADKYLDIIDEAIVSVAVNSKIGVNADYIRKNYRKLHAHKHLIFYQVSEVKLSIIRILNDDMDYKSHL
ncbi:MAG: type II toxin-antitoxin system RelE/ParE family toxin [Proteobacteria bacterium]|nr:type II toxin-antitoxin system RelE/ParE family toxin [Pseudomonadota bacterium]